MDGDGRRLINTSDQAFRQVQRHLERVAATNGCDLLACGDVFIDLNIQRSD